jgi:hypothetical protein
LEQFVGVGVDDDVRGVDAQRSTIAHRVTGVDREVDQYLLDLAGVDRSSARGLAAHQYESHLLRYRRLDLCAMPFSQDVDADGGQDGTSTPAS